MIGRDDEVLAKEPVRILISKMQRQVTGAHCRQKKADNQGNNEENVLPKRAVFLLLVSTFANP
jgi:hypothetical protein